MKPTKQHRDTVQDYGNMIKGLKDHKMILLQASILLAVTAIIFYQDLAQIFGRALQFTEGNITNYVITIPFLIAIIIYRKRQIIAAAASVADRHHNFLRIDDVLGITLCVIAMLLYVYGSETLYALELHVVSLTMFLAGGTVLLFNLTTLRHAAVGILLTLYLQPPPGELVSELAADLSWSIAVIVETLLRTFGMPIALDSTLGAPALLITLSGGERIPFFIGEPSSGVFSTIGLSLFALFVAYIIRGPLWKRITLFILGFPIFFILNAFRIAIILTLYYTAGHDVAESFHVVSGSLMVAIGTIAILIVGEKVFRLNIRTPKIMRKKCPACDKSLAKGESLCLYCGISLKPKDRSWKITASRMIVLAFLCGIVVGGSLTTAQAPSNQKDSKLTSKLSELDMNTIKGPETTSYFLPQVDGWELRYAYRDNQIESVLNQDAALAFRYTLNATVSSPSSEFAINPYVYSSVQISTGHHTWKDSLVTYPSRVGRPGATIIEDSQMAVSDGVSGTFMLYKRVGSKTSEAVLYWFERVPLKFGSEFENRNVLISIWTNTDMLARNGVISTSDDTVAIKQLYLSFAKEIRDYWNVQFPQASNSKSVNSFIREYFGMIAIIVTIPAGLVSAYYVAKKKILARSAYGRLYNALPASDRYFLDAITSPANDDKFKTGRSISKVYCDLTGRNMADDEALERLESAQRSGLVERKIASANDESILVWKPTFQTMTKSMKTSFSFLERKAMLFNNRQKFDNQRGKSPV